MTVANACPRCRGTLTRVMDIGETYHSCVQCGHVVYGEASPVSGLRTETRWQRPEAADRAAVRRKLIAKERAKANRRAAA